MQEGTPAEVARRPATEYVAKLVGLNLYAGDADGAQVKLAAAVRSSYPTTTSTARCSSRSARQPWSSASTSPHTSARNTWPATIVGLTLLTDRVRIDLEGEPSALVDVTPAAVSELELTRAASVADRQGHGSGGLRPRAVCLT